MAAPTSPSIAPTEPVRPRRTWIVRIFRTAILTLVAIVVLGGVAVPWWLSDANRFGTLATSFLPELDGRISFDRVRLGWLGPIVLEGMKVVPNDGTKPPVSVAQVEGSHGLFAMLVSGGDIGRLAIDGVGIDLVFDENHETNLEHLFGAKEAAAGAATAPSPRRTPIRMVLDVQDAVVTITAPWTVEPWVSDSIAIRASLAPSDDGPYSEWTIAPTQVLADTRMDPPVAWGVLAYIAPVLADAARTSGRFSLSLAGAKLPVGAPGSGSISGTLSMHEVVVGPGPLVSNLIESLPAGFPKPTAVRIADESHVKFRLADRKVWHEGLEFGVPLPVEGRRLDIHSTGTVALDDRSMDLRLSLPIPADLPKDRPLLAALSGKTVSVGVAGSLDEPQIVFDGSIRDAATQVAGELLQKVPELIDRVRGERPIQPSPPSGQAVPTTGSTRAPAVSGDEIVDIVGTVIDEVAKRRAERREAEEAGEVPPRRGRLRDRLFRPQDQGQRPE
jgi:hypothetical protein